MKSRAILSAATFGLAATAGVAEAQCVTVEPQVAPVVRLDPMDATGPAEVVQPLSLAFRRANMGASDLVVHYQIVDEDSSTRSRVGRAAGPLIEWRAEGSQRDIGVFRSEAYALLRSAQITLSEDELVGQQSVTARFTNLREDLPAGVYREQFTVRYWCGPPDASLPYEAPGAIAVTVAVPNVLSVNVAGASAGGAIDFMDFGMLSRTLQVSVRSTGPYQVTARSLNGGVMYREGAVTAGALDRIPYAARLDGALLDPSGVTTRRMPRAGLGGRMLALEVEVEGVESVRAGDYADTLMIELRPVN